MLSAEEECREKEVYRMRSHVMICYETAISYDILMIGRGMFGDFVPDDC